jgi:hypothetical protein
MDVRLKVDAGARDRAACPVVVEVPGNGVALVQTGGQVVPCQSRALPGGRCELRFVVEGLPAGATRDYVATLGDHAPGAALSLRDDGQAVRVLAGGREVTAYHYCDPQAARPYWWPLPGPFGAPLTRAWPMAKVAGEKQDHKHHRSLWVAYGELNGTDNWSEEPTCATQTHQGWNGLSAGDVAVVLDQNVCWRAHLGDPVLHERRVWRWYRALGATQLIDLEIDLTPAPGVEEVTFGDTKEGGLCSVRVATSMDVPAGRIQNSAGGINEGETWGKRAHWCDYSGPVAGQTVGIAIFDHPESFRHPTWWHVRNYGLMTANCFGLSHFTKHRENGSYVLPSGRQLRFRYRLCLHAGNADEGKVADRYQDYANPPTITVG